MCNFEKSLSSKRVTLGVRDSTNSADELVSADMQCRGCSVQDAPEHMSGTKRELLAHGCIDKSDVCRYASCIIDQELHLANMTIIYRQDKIMRRRAYPDRRPRHQVKTCI